MINPSNNIRKIPINEKVLMILSTLLSLHPHIDSYLILPEGLKTPGLALKHLNMAVHCRLCAVFNLITTSLLRFTSSLH